MSFDWTHYLHLAQELTGDNAIPSDEEAKLRSAISRAYYAVHCAARNLARQKDNYTKPRFDPHQALIKHFLESPHRDRKSIGIHLQRLRDNRVKADYENQVRDLVFMSKTSIQFAQAALNIIKNLNADQTT